MLSQHFLELTNKELNKQVKGFTEESIEHLLSYPWPGNIRELKNVVRRAVLLTSDIIEPKHLLLPRNESWYPHAPHGVERLTKDGSPLKGIVRRAVEEVERKAILEVLRRTGGNKSEAARLLKIDYSTMHYKIKQYGIKLFNGTEEE